jgi:superfamily II DNA/RNA helicase
MIDPERILVKEEPLSLEGIKQFYIKIENDEWKNTTLLDLYASLDIKQALIYCNSKKKV